MRVEDGHIVESTVEARAGFLDRPIIGVLVASTMLAVGLIAAIYIVMR